MSKSRSAPLLASVTLAGVLALSVAGCKTTDSTETTGSIGRGAPSSEAQWRGESQAWGERYRANPRDAQAAVRYARASPDGSRFAWEEPAPGG